MYLLPHCKHSTFQALLTLKQARKKLKRKIDSRRKERNSKTMESSRRRN